MVDRKPVRNM